MPESKDIVLPQDSASNAPRRRTVNGSIRSTSGRQTERVRFSTRESVRISTRSPAKDYPRKGAGDREPKVVDPPTVSSPATDRQPTVTSRNKELPPCPWSSQVSLIARTAAPLAGRITRPPLARLLPQSLEPRPLKQLSKDEQESAILEDLLSVFMGYEGQYIRFIDSYNPSVERDLLDGPTYRILPGLSPSLKDLASSVLKMATHYSAVEAFIEVQSRDEFGTINHALCASIRRMLDEYLILIVQLENQLISNSSFTLHLLQIQTLPTRQWMLQLYTLAHEILRKNSLWEEETDGFNDVDNIIQQLQEGGDLTSGSMSKKVCKGGSVLRLLTQRLSLMSGDPSARNLLQTLLRDASRPYMAMLNEWLHHGGIKDPHGEFLIKERKSIKREKLEEDYTDEYWEKRYTIRENDVPPQLEGVKDKVLLAGKYLNVVRECGGVDISKEVGDVPKSFDDTRFLDNVIAAYAHANSSLLNLLLTTHALPARLRSLKHYFFLDRSDFFTYFLDLSESELKKPYKTVNVGKLQSLLDLVLRQPGSVAAQDPFKEDVKVRMNHVGLTKFLMGVVNVTGLDQDSTDGSLLDRPRSTVSQTSSEEEMTGFEALELKFSVPFPLSLVISSKTVLRYQILFRYLLSTRHLESLLVNSWKEHHKVVSWSHRSANPQLEMWKRRAWTLRSRMLVFVQQFSYYCTAEVIEPNWQTLMARVNGTDKIGRDGSGSQKVSRTVDELMEDHVDFLDTCLKECMLMNSKLLKIHAKIMSVCQLFASWTITLSRQLCSADKDLAGSPAATIYLSSQYTSRHHPIPDALKHYDPTRLPKMEDMLSKYEFNFNHHLRLLLDALDYYAATETVALSRLCAQLSMAREAAGDKNLVVD